jgi:hypothetical protein
MLVKLRRALMEKAKAAYPEPVGLVLQDEAKVVLMALVKVALELREMLPRLLLVVVALLGAEAIPTQHLKKKINAPLIA